MKPMQDMNSGNRMERRAMLKWAGLLCATPVLSLLKAPASAAAQIEKTFANQKSAKQSTKENKLKERWCIPH